MRNMRVFIWFFITFINYNYRFIIVVHKSLIKECTSTNYFRTIDKMHLKEKTEREVRNRPINNASFLCKARVFWASGFIIYKWKICAYASQYEWNLCSNVQCDWWNTGNEWNINAPALSSLPTYLNTM